MSTDVEPTGILARVTATSDGGKTACFDLRNGKSGSLTSDSETFSVGQVLVVSGDIERNENLSVRKVPDDAWPEETWVGVVKIKLSDLTVIESGGRFRSVPTSSAIEYSVGNTVEAKNQAGVTRVLSEKPIRYIEIDLPELDEGVVERFRTDSRSLKLDFDDFGGLPAVVSRARELIEVPLEHGKSLQAIGARPVKGVLFTGEPGTGKTMLARIIASQADAAFYEISGPEIFSKWYGQSEELLRKLFDAAGRDNRAIIFFDEIDSIAAQRDDESHEASKRVVAQLLTLMDGFNPDSNVVVIATTNRPQDLDVALRRPGRFDWEIEFPYPDSFDRLDILVKTEKHHRTKGPLPHAVVAAMSDGWSAAELAQIWCEAALLAVEDSRSDIWEEDYIGGYERVASPSLTFLAEICGDPGGFWLELSRN